MLLDWSIIRRRPCPAWVALAVNQLVEDQEQLIGLIEPTEVVVAYLRLLKWKRQLASSNQESHDLLDVGAADGAPGPRALGAAAQLEREGVGRAPVGRSVR